jgi:hypothetical protein
VADSASAALRVGRARHDRRRRRERFRERGFELGQIAGATRGARDTRRFEARRADGDPLVQLAIDSAEPRDLAYIGLVLPIGLVLQDITLADGRPASELANAFELTTLARHREDVHSPAPWLDIPIQLRVEAGGHGLAPGRFEFTLGSGLPDEARLWPLATNPAPLASDPNTNWFK